MGMCKLVGLLRFEVGKSDDPADLGLEPFMLMYTESNEGAPPGRGQSFHGSAPHHLVHSIGALIGTYTYRREAYDERAMISRDEERAGE